MALCNKEHLKNELHLIQLGNQCDNTIMGKIFKRALGPQNLMTDSKQACFCKVSLTQLVTKGASRAAQSVTVSGMDCDRMETGLQHCYRSGGAVSLPLG